MTTTLTAVTVVSVLGLVTLGTRRAYLVLKPLASIGFVAVAWAAYATATSYGTWILIGLILGAIGDIALISTDDTPFLIGLASFLLGHLAYVIALVPAATAANMSGLFVLAAVAASAAIGGFAWRWMEPGIPRAMRSPVIGYVVVISAMLATAVLAVTQRPLAAAGGVLFTASDLAVARERFLSQSVWNARVGLPVYYAGQLLFAWSILL